MVERLRALLERPLDPSLCRAALVLACALTVGFAALVALGAIGSSRTGSSLPSRLEGARSAVPVAPAPRPRAAVRGDRPANPEQDPQDRTGSGAHRRAAQELATHRALQHAPYRHGGVSIDFVGARGGRAVLRVRADTLAAARLGWRDFLRRYRDPGTAYIPHFEARGGRIG